MGSKVVGKVVQGTWVPTSPKEDAPYQKRAAQIKQAAAKSQVKEPASTSTKAKSTKATKKEVTTNE